MSSDMSSQGNVVETTLACCVCGAHEARRWRVAADHLLGSPERFQAVRCARCGTARLDPRPPAEEMGRYYTAATYARAEEAEKVGGSGLGERLDEYNRRLAERTDALIDQGAPRRVLDVGCGDGRFLGAMAERGWEVEGLETDPVAAALARKRTGGTVHEAPLEDLMLPENRFGLVSLLHVLEHVPDPRATLCAARRTLAPGGTLLIAVPNAGSFEAALFRSVWYPLDLPRHYWGFTPHTLVRLVETCGFSISGVRHFPFLFAPQSIRYGLKALQGQPIADRAEKHGKEGTVKREGGGLRTRAFLALLGFSERLGRHLPGEVMELRAEKPL
jgi:SAM-dependent methyltransferase